MKYCIKQTMKVVLLVLLMLPTMTLHAQGPIKVDPPPGQYADVADDYAAIENAVIVEGNAVLDQLLNGEFDAVHERATAEMQPYLTPDQLQSLMESLNDVAPIGEQLDYRVIIMAATPAFVATYAWNDGELIIAVIFNIAAEISGMQIHPIEALPEDPAAGYESGVTFRLPFDGLWYTAWGGLDVLHNYHVDYPPQRHAYDFVVWRDGATCGGDCLANTDYYAYGQPVLAPAAGEVIAVANDLPESLPQVETDEANPLGNHVVIRVAADEYLFIAHMQPNSITVEVGDTVIAGQPIGLTGNSGNTSEPHIHIHLQDTPELFVMDDAGEIVGFADARGLPLRFTDYRANGVAVEIGVPLGGQFVVTGTPD